jgi:hypothetical protein
MSHCGFLIQRVCTIGQAADYILIREMTSGPTVGSEYGVCQCSARSSAAARLFGKRGYKSLISGQRGMEAYVFGNSVWDRAEGVSKTTVLQYPRPLHIMQADGSSLKRISVTIFRW